MEKDIQTNIVEFTEKLGLTSKVTSDDLLFD